jgi:hypothetical protein
MRSLLQDEVSAIGVSGWIQKGTLSDGSALSRLLTHLY